MVSVRTLVQGLVLLLGAQGVLKYIYILMQRHFQQFQISDFGDFEMCEMVQLKK